MSEPLMQLVFATNNAHKVREVQAAVGHDIQIITLQQAGIAVDIPEPYDTLAENASEKSGVISRMSGQNCFSEDTGLEVDALGGKPGVRTARYAGENCSSTENINKLLHNLAGIQDRTARFRTIVSLRLGEKEFFFEGVCEGFITGSEQGTAGFGYDPVFSPAGSGKTFAEMTLEEKGLYSHRKKAMNKLVAFLQQLPSTHVNGSSKF